MTQEGYQVIIILPIKSRMAAAEKQYFLRFLYLTKSSTPSFKVRDLQMTIHLAFIHISSRHSKLNFAHHFVIYLLFQNGANKNQHHKSHQRETVRQKRSMWWAKYMYVCEWDMCWRNFCNFSLVTKTCEKYDKNSPFLQMSAILKYDFQNRKQLLFSELNYLNYTKNQILHVTATFSLKQGETRTSSGPPVKSAQESKTCLILWVI